MNPTRAAAEQRERPSPDADELRRIVLRAKTGDADAFAALYDRYVDLVYRYVYFRVGGHALAEDITSETFLRALRRIADFTWQGRDFGAWLVTIARNLVADHFKSGRYRMEVSTAEVLDTPMDGPHIPENAVVATMVSESVLRAVRDLNPEQQECVVLRFLHGMSLAETALIMGKKSGAIKALQFRAVRALARALPDDLN
ncbi:sigma-70 family RNA polymerase sigma factor [Sphaerisporangium sp. NPDC005288]|uniref:Sigma-70 family RNA polymerase sigma factor n=1 Tax=Sphaerisporangium rhizosphaerae TaxID=2269375 RepID=A0ABW2PD71_9ACTN